MKKFIFLGIFSVAIFVLIKAPASFLVPYVNKSEHIQVQGITGNLFSGTMQTTGKIDTLLYRISPWQLLLANLSVDIRATQGSNFLESEIILDLITQKVSLNRASGTLDLTLLQQYIPEFSTLGSSGHLSFNNLQAVWTDIQTNQIPQQFSGSIELLNLNALGQYFGDYQALIETQAPNIVANLSNKKSATSEVKIKFNLLDKKKQLAISGVIAGKNEDVKAILQQLNITKIEKIIRY